MSEAPEPIMPVCAVATLAALYGCDLWWDTTDNMLPYAVVKNSGIAIWLRSDELYAQRLHVVLQLATETARAQRKTTPWKGSTAVIGKILVVPTDPMVPVEKWEHA